MYRYRLALLVLTATLTGCDSQNTAPTAAVVEESEEAESGVVEMHMPSWVQKFDDPRSGARSSGRQYFDDWGSAVDNLAEEVSRDPNHVDVLRHLFATCTKQQAFWGAQVLQRLMEIDPILDYLELSDILFLRPDVTNNALLVTAFAAYPLSMVSDRFAQILYDENNSSDGGKLVAIRTLIKMSERDGCDVIRADLDDATGLILNNVDGDSFLRLQTLILQRTCDLISREDCLEHLDAILEREGSDFRPEWAREVRELCARN